MIRKSGTNTVHPLGLKRSLSKTFKCPCTRKGKKNKKINNKIFIFMKELFYRNNIIKIFNSNNIQYESNKDCNILPNAFFFISFSFGASN